MFHAVAWSLVLSGGVGNPVDRIVYDGRVVDFMNLGIGSLHTGIFNVADVYIRTGAFLLVLRAFQRPGVSTPASTESLILLCANSRHRAHADNSYVTIRG